ncbi:MAG: EutP/PduV family microcompartment system protein [bacterium]|nr:EutP/PduV family microcompartment system protein [bacterium]
MKDKQLIMFIGKTHSGKTTFAKELEKGNQIKKIFLH